MLIGPTYTLEEFEEILESRLLDNKKRDGELMKRFRVLQQQIATVPRLVADEKTGESIANKEYLDAVDESKSLEQDMQEILEQNDFIKLKLEDLETIEERSRGAIRKDTKKITLTLKDCIDFGITTNATQ